VAISPKPWVNNPDPTTPLDADGQIDQEVRLGAYADSVGAGGIELGYAEITANFTSTSTSPADVTGLGVTVSVGIRPIVIEFGAVGVASSTAGCIPIVAIQETSTVLRAANYPQGISIPTTFRKRLAPAAGTHNYKIVFNLVAAVGTGTITASSTNGCEAYIAVYEI